MARSARPTATRLSDDRHPHPGAVPVPPQSKEPPVSASDARAPVALRLYRLETTVQDLIVVLITVGFFGLCLLFIEGCSRILGPGDELTEDEDIETEPDTDLRVAA